MQVPKPIAIDIFSATRDMSALQQLNLDLRFTAYDEISSYLDDSRTGHYALCTMPQGGKFRQQLLPLHTMAYIVEQYTRGFEQFKQSNGKNDVWISQAAFVSWENQEGDTVAFRRKTTLASIGTLFVDIDYYKDPLLAQLPAQAIANLLLEKCVKLNLPAPSMIVDSGMGIQAKWFHEPLPRKALPRWEAAALHLVKCFEDLGVDYAVRDATRILRVLHTVNQKNGKPVRLLYAPSNTQKYVFDELCQKLLPYSQEEVREFKKANQDKLSSRQRSAVINFNSAKGFSLRTLNWSRFTDLQLLHKLRNHDMGDGLREPLAFYLANQYAICHQNQFADPNMYHELLRIVKDTHVDLNHNKAQEKASRIHKLMVKAGKGDTVTKPGVEGLFTPLYTPKNSTLIDLFGITDDEQKAMDTIISDSEKKRRNAALKMEQRREAGAVSREEYLSTANANAQRAKDLAMKGLSQRAIALEMKVSRGAVINYLKG